jgi:hypothetical protein
MHGKPLSGLYTNTYIDRLGLSKWIRENTAQDITYLDVVGTPAAIAEIAVTDPDKMHMINSLEFFSAKRALCNNQNIWDTSSNSCIYAYADYTVGNDPRLITKNLAIDPSMKTETTTLKLQDDGWVFGYDCSTW